MSDGLLTIIAFVLGALLGVVCCIWVMSDGWKREAVSHGKAEFYLDPTTFDKKWRWKE